MPRRDFFHRSCISVTTEVPKFSTTTAKPKQDKFALFTLEPTAFACGRLRLISLPVEAKVPLRLAFILSDEIHLRPAIGISPGTVLLPWQHLSNTAGSGAPLLLLRTRSPVQGLVADCGSCPTLMTRLGDAPPSGMLALTLGVQLAYSFTQKPTTASLVNSLWWFGCSSYAYNSPWSSIGSTGHSLRNLERFAAIDGHPSWEPYYGHPSVAARCPNGKLALPACCFLVLCEPRLRHLPLSLKRPCSRFLAVKV